MTTIFPLSEQRLPPSMDVEFLKETFRNRIEELASDYWTDYNTSDPGITMLEIMSYALTDLGLRTQLDISDLVARRKGQDFFTASTILPSAAYTLDDYSKLLCGQTFIRKAWVTSLPSRVKGLYQLLVDLSHPSDERDINVVWLQGDAIISDANNSYEYYVVFPYWEELTPQQLELWEGTTDLLEVSISEILLPDLPENNFFDEYASEVSFGFEGGETMTLLLRMYLPKGIPKTKPDGTDNTAEETDVRAKILAQLDENVAFFEAHQQRSRERASRLDQTINFIRQHRNLCEDWGDISTIRVQQIGLQIGTLELKAAANAVEVLARIYIKMAQFINPDITTQTLGELLEAGRSPAEIFEGVSSNKGFVSSLSQLNEQKERIYTSDLVRLIMEDPAVIGIRELSLDLYLDRIKAITGAKNCLKLRHPVLYKPQLSVEDSNIEVVKKGIPVPVSKVAILEAIRAINDIEEISSISNTDDIGIPDGDSQLDLTTFYSIQNDFPETYGLKAGEIVETASVLRKAQAKQLKAYLLFFEQLFKDYCAQLANVQDLFSMRKEVNRTRFHQSLYDVPAVENVLEAHQNGSLSWEDFKETRNDYIKALEDASENRSSFLQRRNQFIDHLLARLGEDFRDYTAWSFAQQGGRLSPDLVFDKLAFLQKTPELGSRRAKAFNYAAVREDPTDGLVPNVWDSKNVSGYEKRVYVLLGIPNPKRRSLSLFEVEDFFEIEINGNGNKQLSVWSDSDLNNPNRRLLLKTILEPDEAQHIEALKSVAGQAVFYQIKDITSAGQETASYTFEINNTAGDIIVPATNNQALVFSNRAEVEWHIRDILHLFQGRHTEGMHLIEHVLLRPLAGVNETLNPIEFDIQLKGDEEPTPVRLVTDLYSFQVSIFLPAWAPRFRNLEFRAVLERKLREELPAHIFPWIFWVNPLEELDDGGQQIFIVPSEFIGFENSYQEWLENFDTEERLSSQEAFIQAFNELVSSQQVVLSHAYQIFEL